MGLLVRLKLDFLLRLKVYVIIFMPFLLLASFHMRTLVEDRPPPEKDDIQSMISALRGSGYHLFAKALEMVDIQPLLSSRDSYTFFAPPDAALYDLILASKSWQEYTDAVKCHIVNTKLSYYSLSRLPDGAHLGRLLCKRSLTLTTFTPNGDEQKHEVLMVNNAAVSFPDLYYDNRFAAHGVAAVLNPIAVDAHVLSVRAFWKAAKAVATASRERELHGDAFAQSKPLPVCSYPIHNASVTPSEKAIEKKLRETFRHQDDSSTAPVLPAPAGPSPCDAVAANGSLKVNGTMSSKKVGKVICSTTSTSHWSVSVGEHCSSAEYSGDQKYTTHDRPHYHHNNCHQLISGLCMPISILLMLILQSLMMITQLQQLHPARRSVHRYISDIIS